MIAQKVLLHKSLAAAMELRRNADLDPLSPICVFDLAAEMGVEVRFVSLPSIEGLYAAGSPPTIIIGSQRPAGRRTFTCAHELGHHIFGHGTRVDLMENAQNAGEFLEEEFLAQAFAGFLLMPKLAVLRAFKLRGLRPETATPTDLYRISRYFGVGFMALVQHLRGIGVITPGQSAVFQKINLSQIRRVLAHGISSTRILPVDTAWVGRAIDTEVGELLVTPPYVLAEGRGLEPVSHPSAQLFKATQPGCCRLTDTQSDWAAHVRVSKENYEGRSLWRHLADEDDL